MNIRKISILFIFVFWLLFPILIAFHYPLHPDEGIILNGSEYILKGKVLYKDIFEFIGPVSFFINVPLFKIFGVNLIFPRIFVAFLISIEALILFFISSKILDLRWRIWMCFFFVITVSTLLLIPSHKWYSSFFTLVTALFLYLFFERKNSLYLILSGFTAGSVFMTMINNGTLLILSILVLLFLFYRKHFKRFLVNSLYFGLGLILFNLLIIFYLIKYNILKEFLYSVFVFPFIGYLPKHTGFFYTYFIGTPLELLESILKLRITKAVTQFFWVFMNYLPIFIFIYFLYAHILKPKIIMNFIYPRNNLLCMFFILGLFQYISAIVQTPQYHRLLSTYPFVFLLFFRLIQEIFTQNKAKSRYNFFKKLTLKSGILFLLSYLMLRSFTYLFNLCSTRKYILRMKKAIVFVSKEEKKGLEQLEKFVLKHIKTEDYVFCIYGASTLFFLIDRPNPTKYDYVAPGGYYKKIEEDIFKSLKIKKPIYIFNTWGNRNIKDIYYYYLLKNYLLIDSFDIGSLGFLKIWKKR